MGGLKLGSAEWGLLGSGADVWCLVVVLGKERRRLVGDRPPPVREGQGQGQGQVVVVGEGTD